MLLDDSTQIPKDFVQFMNTGLDLPNLSFTLLDEGFLVSKLRGRQLRLEDLSLALFDSTVVLRPVSDVINIRTSENRKTKASSDILAVFFFYSNPDTLYDCALTFRGDLLRALERDEG